MSQELENIKAKVAAQSTALDSINTNVSGIATDVAYLKQKLADLSSGATPEEIAELSTSVDSISEKINLIGTTTADLDAQTDPTV